MSCKNVCKLCNHLAISTSVTFTGGNLVIDLPANTYRNGEKVCIIVAQAIPAATTINAPVVITIGGGAVQYPLTNKCCTQVTVCGIRTRTRYSTCVVTSSDSATFRLLGRTCCVPNNNLASINGDGTPVTPASTGNNTSNEN